MKCLCCVCNCRLDNDPTPISADDAISHGYCAGCERKALEDLDAMFDELTSNDPDTAHGDHSATRQKVAA